MFEKYGAIGIFIGLIVSLLMMIVIAFNAGKSDGYIEGQLDCQNGDIKQYEVVYNNTRYGEVSP